MDVIETMETVFASQSGCVRNTAVAIHAPPPAAGHPDPNPAPVPAAGQASGLGGQASGLGGQIGELAAALAVIGWNHNQVPPDERIPPDERT
jgi:hypothetical protein